MNNKEKNIIIKSSIQMFESLNNVIREAKGGDGITWETLENMTVQDLIISLASNGVRFCYINDKKTKQSNQAFICPHGYTFGRGFEFYEECSPDTCVNYKYCEEEI